MPGGGVREGMSHSRRPLNPEANFLGLLIPLNPLHSAWGWVLGVENGQLIANLHCHGIVHFNHYTNSAKGLVENRGTLLFIPDDHRRFGRIWRESSPITALRESHGFGWQIWLAVHNGGWLFMMVVETNDAIQTGLGSLATHGSIVPASFLGSMGLPI